MDDGDIVQAMTRFYDHFTAWEEEVIQGSGISVAQMHLLEVLGHRGHLKMKDLAQALGVRTGTLTVMVHRLESKGLIVRTKDPADARIQYVALSPLGERSHQEHHAYHAELARSIIRRLGPQGSQEFFAALDQAAQVLEGEES